MLPKKACAVAVILALAASALAYDIRISRLDSYELAFSAKPPRTIQATEAGAPVNYTYIVYEVKNNTDKDVDFYPCFQVEAKGDGAATAGVYSGVARILAERFDKAILDASAISGIIKPGEARKGAAIFTGIDPHANEMTVYVSGLSGDFKMDMDKDGKLVTLYRTYKMVYWRGGDGAQVSINPVELKSAEWIWRQ